ncbi:hypothetical protein, partial [Acidihalobacter prosperus]
AKQPFARKRMAAGPVQACVREVARRGQAISGVRFFRRFLCAFKEKIVGNDFSRKPRRGEAQGCVEQIGSGASPGLSETVSLESRTKQTQISQERRS